MTQERGGKPIELKRNFDSGGNLLPPGFVQLETGEVVPWYQTQDYKTGLQGDLVEARRKLPFATAKTLKRTIRPKPF